MNQEVFSYHSSGNSEIKYYRWKPETKAKAVVQIIHGMAEHAGRYTEFADYLNENEYVVYAEDHRGHGLTAGCYENTGFLADRQGWENVVADCKLMTDIIKEENPDLPVFLIGHSMGSFIARNLIAQESNNYQGVILSGTSWNPFFLLLFGGLVARMQILFYGKKYRSKLLDQLSFGSFNKKFKPNRTDFDWLSRVPEIVDRYINDEYCGFVCTAGFFKDLFTGILKIQSKKNIRKINPELPLLLACGENDPVGQFSKTVKTVYRNYKECGIKDLELKIYFQARHEILNETNRKDVYHDFLRWMDFRL